MPKENFIGRSRELSRVQQFVESERPRGLLFIRGKGGMGKTSMLNEVSKAYSRKKGYRLSSVIDFDAPKYRLPDNVLSEISKLVGYGQPFSKDLDEYVSLMSGSASSRVLQSYRDRILSDLIVAFNRRTERKEVIILFDTVENMTRDVWSQLLSLFPLLKNVRFILSGREEFDNLWQQAEGLFRNDAKVLPLGPLSSKDGREFIVKALEEKIINLPTSTIRDILFWTGGRPILIDIAVEWASRDIGQDWFARLNRLPKPDPNSPGFQRHFAKLKDKLVQGVIQLHTPLDRLVLALANVYPADEKLVSNLLGVNEQQALSLIEQAKNLVFVKILPDGSITLHDEFRAMVIDSIWERMDKDETERTFDRKSAIKYFADKWQELTRPRTSLPELPEELKSASDYLTLANQIVLAEDFGRQWVRTAVLVDLETGINALESVDDNARQRGWNSFLRDLYAQEEKRFVSSLFWNRFYVRMKRVEFALGRNPSIVLKELESFANLPESELEDLPRSIVYNTIGMILRNLRNYDEALIYQKKALEIGQKNPKLSLAPIYTQIGFLYRLKQNLARAEENYRLALASLSNPNSDLAASLLNNIGYIYILRGDEAKALIYCEEALRIRKRLEQTRQLGDIYTTLAILERNRNDFDKAISLLNRALGGYSMPEDYREVCRAHFHLGWSLWFKWEELNRDVIFDWEEGKGAEFLALQILRDAKRAFDISRDLAERFEVIIELPGILNQMSNVYWWLEQATERRFKYSARKLNQEALELSRKVDDIRYAIDSLLGIVEFEYDDAHRKRTAEAMKRLSATVARIGKELYSDYGKYERGHELYFGRMRRFEADVAFEQGDFPNAFRKYAEAVFEINIHGGFGRYSTSNELIRLGRKLDQLDDKANRWVAFLRKDWTKRKYPKSLLEGDASQKLRQRFEAKRVNLLGWCDLQEDRLGRLTKRGAHG